MVSSTSKNTYFCTSVKPALRSMAQLSQGMVRAPRNTVAAAVPARGRVNTSQVMDPGICSGWDVKNIRRNEAAKGTAPTSRAVHITGMWRPQRTIRTTATRLDSGRLVFEPRGTAA